MRTKLNKHRTKTPNQRRPSRDIDIALHSYTVLYEPAEEGGFYAHITALALTTEGESLDEAKKMARDAIAGYLEAAKELGKSVPVDVTVEHIEVPA